MNNYKTIAESDPTLALAGLRIELEILTRNLAKGFKGRFSPYPHSNAMLSRASLGCEAHGGQWLMVTGWARSQKR
jgi:hypothetical protein